MFTSDYYFPGLETTETKLRILSSGTAQLSFITKNGHLCNGSNRFNTSGSTLSVPQTNFVLLFQLIQKCACRAEQRPSGGRTGEANIDVEQQWMKWQENLSNWWIVSFFLILQAEMSNMIWFQLHKYDDLLLFFVSYDSKLNIFGFVDCWTNKTRHLKMLPSTMSNYNGQDKTNKKERQSLLCFSFNSHFLLIMVCNLKVGWTIMEKDRPNTCSVANNPRYPVYIK